MGAFMVALGFRRESVLKSHKITFEKRKLRESMEKLLLRSLIRCWFLLFLLLPTMAHSSDPCLRLEESLATQQAELEALKTQNEHLSQLLGAQMQNDFNINEALSFELDTPYQVSAQLTQIRETLDALPAENQLPAGFKGCDKANQWQTLQKQIVSYKTVILKGQTKLLQLALPLRRALVRESNRWLQLHRLQAEIDTWAESHPENPAVWQLKNEINQWIDAWRSSTRIWFAQIRATQTEEVAVDHTWVATLIIDSPNKQIQWNNPNLDTLADYPDYKLRWQVELEKAHLSLLRVTQRWHNHRIWAQGWGSFIKQLADPIHVWEHLKTEILSAPLNLLDTLSRPFIHDYRHALKQDKKGELLSNWFLQSLALVVLLSSLLKLAAVAPQYIATLQQRVFTWFQHRYLIQVTSSLLWFIKPNSPWLLVLICTQFVAQIIPDTWFILKAVAPLGILYSAYRAVRVIMEWLLSRSFTRSSQFVSSQIAQSQAKDVHKISWVLVLSTLGWMFVKGTGGGYLLFVVTLFVIVLSWCAMLQLLWRYKDAIARFLLYCLGNNTKQKDTLQKAQRWWIVLFWPALFIVAHIEDLVRHLHQKLLVLDAYRAFAIKLLRIRMAAEAKDDENDENEAELPDENYNDWMLRKLDKARIDTGRMDIIIDNMKLWQSEKSADNVQLIIGHQGSGKSTLIEQLRQSWEETSIRILDIPAKTTQPEQVHTLMAQHFGLDNVSSVADLVKQEEALEQQVVVVDNTHNLFLSEVGHLSGFRTMNQYLNARLGKVYWVMVMHSSSWFYLRCVYEREMNFANIYTMPRWSPGDIRKLILSRHQGSGRRIKYNELLLSASAGNESSSVRAADSRVFNILWEQSNGIPLVALHLWLAAARSKGRMVEVGVPEKPSNAPLKELSDDLCFVFAAIVTHETLNSKEIRMVTHYEDPIVRHALKQGIKMGLLMRDDELRYRIHASWQGTLKSFLASKNMILTG